jgi:ATP-dependent DNA ligase
MFPARHHGVIGDGRPLYRAAVDADLEGIVAKRLTAPYQPKLTRWHKILNRTYSQRHGRAEWFRKRRGRDARR